MTNHSIACPAVSVTPPIVASLTVCPALQLMTSIVDWGVPWVLCSEHCGVWGMGVGGVGLGHTPLAGFCAHERVPGRADMWFVVFSHCPHCLPTATPPVLGGHLGGGGRRAVFICRLWLSCLVLPWMHLAHERRSSTCCCLAKKFAFLPAGRTMQWLSMRSV